LKRVARQEIERLESQPSLFIFENDELIEEAISSLSNSSISTVGPELIFGRIYDHIGFGQVKEELFRHLVISRLAFPLSKLKTTEYLYRYQGRSIDVNAIYRFLDRLSNTLKPEVEKIAFEHTKRTLKDNISVVFYDMTTLYFEASDEDDLRKAGFSKDGKHSNPQIFIGLLVGLGGYAIGYDIFEGNTYEGHTLIPFLESISAKFKLNKPIVVADSGLLSDKNIKALEKAKYKYIIGARLKNESEELQEKVVSKKYKDGMFYVIRKNKKQRLIVHYSIKRAKKDFYNRKKGLNRLEKNIKSGKLTKASINNRGYNKYLQMDGKVNVKIDYQKFEQDARWDGLKGYVTNTRLKNDAVLENYKNLFHIERAFRMSKTDLRIRPIYHRLRHRIEAHICIAFTAYTVYKELERVLKEENASISLQTASEITHNMYQITYQLPESKHIKSALLNMDTQQRELYDIVQKNFQGVAMRKTGKQNHITFFEKKTCAIHFFLLFHIKKMFTFAPILSLI
ncbi:MAG: IS1634 family transposase, partial [Lentimicrobiaceae bacterium]|nr:IS1634 family transposase [Lentimicrobiaceae bacterium]